jgi:eukaryotic-like serine/threonine-protein kinase
MKSKRQEKSDKIFELFQGALEVDKDRRAAFLDRGCGDDEELRKEVEALLAYDKRAERFIESPAIQEAPELIADDEDSSTVTMDAVGPFKLVRKLGSGGMGEVYLARDSRLGRNVALKLLDRNLIADSGSRMRFLREARLASALDHPNICTIHEVGEAAGLLFIAMQYVEGETLKQVIASHPLDLESLLSMSLQVSNALAAAHTQGIIHRDIKSSNIMITPGGQAKVLDFGLARPLEREDDDSELTHAGAVMGTPTYMSPEQARGERTDHRSDIFSLGVVMYEMATGRTPFKCKSREQTMNAVIHQPHAPVAELNNEVPSELCAVIDKALAKQADDRYQSVGDVTNELRRVAKIVGLEGYNSSDPLMVPYVPPSTSGGWSRKRGSIPPLWQVTASCLLVVMAAAITYLMFFRNASSLSAGEIKSLAVLPLENLSGDPSQEYFADGMTDALIGDLAKITGLQVISRTSSMHYKGTKQPLNEIARELKVDAVVEGTVQRSGDRVRVRAQLIRASTDQHLWSETYERDLRDVLALESEIAQAVVREIQMKITPDEQARLSDRVGVNRKALDDYLQGRYLLGRKEQLHRAIEYFQSALKQDPNYAPAYAGLAASYNTSQSVAISELPPLEARRQAEAAALKALQLDGTLAEAHAALGYIYHYDWNWDAAEQELRRAIELDPNSAQAHSIYSLHLSANEKRAGEAIAEADRAQELDPLSLSASTLRGFVLTNARRYDEAIEQLRRVIALDPNNYLAHWFLGAAYAADRRFDEAIAVSERAVVLSNRAPGALGVLGMCYGLAGRKAEATKILNELLALNRHRYVTPVALVDAYIGLGAKDQTFAWLEKAYQERSNFMAYLKVQAITDPLRNDPRFDELLRRMGIPL